VVLEPEVPRNIVPPLFTVNVFPFSDKGSIVITVGYTGVVAVVVVGIVVGGGDAGVTTTVKVTWWFGHRRETTVRPTPTATRAGVRDFLEPAT
jgi:hypothetical protein